MVGMTMAEGRSCHWMPTDQRTIDAKQSTNCASLLQHSDRKTLLFSHGCDRINRKSKSNIKSMVDMHVANLDLVFLLPKSR